MSATGLSSPVSTSSTLTNSDGLVKQREPHSFLTPSIAPGSSVIATASAILESLASRYSDTVFGYDAAFQHGIGGHTKEWSKAGAGAQYVEMQSRHGAGLVLAGRLGQGTSARGDKNGILTAYTSPEGLGQMAPSLSVLPAAGPSGRVVIHVPGISVIESTLGLTPSLASLSTLLPILPQDFAVVLSATAEETTTLASVSYGVSSAHIIHIFDQFSSAREVRRTKYPGTAADSAPSITVKQGVVNAGFRLFDYHGSKDAQTVIVALKGSLGSILEAIADTSSNLGVITVRVLRPWDDEAFRVVLPSTTQLIHVLEDVHHYGGSGFLYQDVLSTVLGLARRPQVKAHGITPDQAAELVSAPTSIVELLRGLGVAATLPSTPSFIKKLVFYTTPSSTLTALPQVVAQSFTTTPAIIARLVTDYDAFSKPGGIATSKIVLGTGAAGAAAELPHTLLVGGHDAGGADFIAVTDQSLVKTHDVLAAAHPRSLVLLFSQWSTEEVAANLPKSAVQIAKEKELFLYTMDSKNVAATLAPVHPVEAQQVLENVLAHLAFLRLYLGVSCTREKLIKAARALFGDVVECIEMAKIVEALWDHVFQVVLPDEEDSTDAPPKPLKALEFNALEVESFRGLDQAGEQRAAMATWRDAAKHVFFKEAYHLAPSNTDAATQQPASLRPDIEERTFQVTCAVNRRLTPTTYDRNVFHLEFDTTGTGLKYEIGEALGVHGWNDADEILAFCAWYGLDPDALVTIPVPASHRPSAAGPLYHTRTVFQALQQQVDIFGRPPKSFYSALADHADHVDHRLALRFIGAAEGSATFKKLSEVDTVTFADVLRQFDSARPDFAALCELVGDIKPRHYSIASAQSAVGDRVDLLVVTVDWVTPSGTPRYGQCTRYLAALKVGQKVTVSIKPSVMKLPPDNMQPIVMAGLGTGAAPFRAFIQHRAHLASQGIPIGPLVYYFGSRHRSEEYLYGEELEAYIDEGIITHAGFAFSRDQKKKIYIQHKMLEDGKMLAEYLAGNNPKGVFYLCGPTWPVPDVYEALVGALGQYAGYTREAAGEYLESLKEEERYVLEVY